MQHKYHPSHWPDEHNGTTYCHLCEEVLAMNRLNAGQYPCKATYYNGTDFVPSDKEHAVRLKKGQHYG